MLKVANVEGFKVFAQIEKPRCGRYERAVRCENGVFDEDPNKQFVRINNTDFSVAYLRRSCTVRLTW